ncbi:MAG: Lrp/AsnC family transcriptional regulator [Desulfamplus sp.]|nr:Lrp/AsnC family transcriptional regulator [Desulfamplus sp.]
MTHQIDDTDKNILNRIQTSFPIHPNPYKLISKELGISEDELLQRLIKMKNNGIIRRIGGNFGPYKLGFFSTLCAASVSDDKLEIFTTVVNRYSGVTHNYMRSHRYNIWFTFIAESMNIIEKNLKEISKETGVDDILNLPATDVFKISANFKVK